MFIIGQKKLDTNSSMKSWAQEEENWVCRPNYFIDFSTMGSVLAGSLLLG